MPAEERGNETTDDANERHYYVSSFEFARAHAARLSEPILVPKVRIDFADFPYPHASDSAEARNL